MRSNTSTWWKGRTKTDFRRRKGAHSRSGSTQSNCDLAPFNVFLHERGAEIGNQDTNARAQSGVIVWFHDGCEAHTRRPSGVFWLHEKSQVAQIVTYSLRGIRQQLPSRRWYAVVDEAFLHRDL